VAGILFYDVRMKTPELHRLVMQAEIDGVARLLFARRVDIDAFDASGRTALMYAAQDPNTDTRILELLLQHGAKLGLQSRGEYDARRTAVAFAVSGGDPRKVATLVDAGASIHYCDAHGHDALLNAVHHRDVARDPRLLDLLKLLISYAVALNTVTEHQESALRVLSRLGRFDVIKVLLEAGAEIGQLKWTALHRATALGTPADMQRLLDDGHSCEERDWWYRTPWLLAILAGDIDKTQLLLDYGAYSDVRGRCGATPLSFAVMGHHPQMLRWLIEAGQDVEQTDDYAATALFEASECDDIECATILLSNGANIDHRNHIPQTALANTRSPAMTKLLLDAGADIRELSRESRRGLLGFSPDPDVAALASVTEGEFTRGRNRRFGTSNPEMITEPFWHAMIRSGVNGYIATKTFDGPLSFDSGPVWCAERFGQSITFLGDGRIAQIGGEHEDSYDPDFCIYNEVFVHEPSGSLVIYGYPESVFAPTDFHTATLIGPHIYVIGNLGYHGTREYGRTPVYRLDTETFAIERIDCVGTAPGWIYDHVANLRSPNEIEITFGKIVTSDGSTEQHAENDQAFVLDVERRMWRAI
jgi:ankyrin repeat protein